MIHPEQCIDSERTVDTFMQLNKTLLIATTLSALIWQYDLTNTHASHETHLQQSSNNAHCGNEHWLQSFEMWSAQRPITPTPICSSEYEVPPILGGFTDWEATVVDKGQK